MDPPFSGLVLDPSKCQKLSIEEKRGLVRELLKWPESAFEKLQTWSRQDLLEILCAEIGKERKYTGLTKQKLIENIFKIIAEKRSGKIEDLDSSPACPVPVHQTPSKKPRKNDHPSRLPSIANNLTADNWNEAASIMRYCQNLACKANLKPEDAFCKRCSCCICHKFDDNKDPSLWLSCSPEAPSQENSCGMSCHLECAAKHERAGIVKTSKCTRLDGSYYCIYCGKVNDLLGCWKKQLLIAKDARRVDVLCYRISLSHKLLSLTEKYKNLHELVDAAKKKLETEFTPVNGSPNMGRGIVNRLAVGAEVQRLCASALDLLETMHSHSEPSKAGLQFSGLKEAQFQQSTLVSSSFIKFEDITPTSFSVVLDSGSLGMSFHEVAGFNLWHCKADTGKYAEEPTCTLSRLKERCLIRDLIPSIEYMVKVVAFDNVRELGMWEVRVTTECIPIDGLMDVVAPETRTLKDCIQSPKANSNGLSFPTERYESNNNGSVYTDLNKSPESYFDDDENPETVDVRKLSDHAQNFGIHQKSEYGGTVCEAEVIEPEETPGLSGSALDEETNPRINMGSNKDFTCPAQQNKTSEVPKSESESNAPSTNEVNVPFGGSDQTHPVTPSRVETSKEISGKSGKLKMGSNVPQVGFIKPDPKKRSEGKFMELCVTDCSLEGAYEYCVKVIRRLECEGLIQTDFRVKFLTWFSLRSSPQERRVVNVYVNTLIDDPASLAGQLVDTFSDAISSKRLPTAPNKLCMKL